MPSEFELIKRYFTHPARHALLGVGDDAALIKPARGMELAVSTDMLVSGRHFFPDDNAYMLGHKALAVNLSDMAAMGAAPRWVTLSLALPRADPKWLKRFVKGFMDLARKHKVDWIGGDTTRGPLNICVQIVGEVLQGKALRRDAAKPDDDIWVSGFLGDAALALAHLQKRLRLEPKELQICLPALHTPRPRVNLGKKLRGLAHAAIDISDGLLADLGHILERSGVGAAVEFNLLPKSGVMEKHAEQKAARQALLAGGDDYELCFTVPARRRGEVLGLSRQLRLRLTRIGKITRSKGLLLLDENGKRMKIDIKGYDHFG
ncbi:MAG TPA: thiamine-phosphate kinase [Burkholderiales bacterium]|nr:thiamine-phosphate kinase [Burkholderiales bacterium]